MVYIIKDDVWFAVEKHFDCCTATYSGLFKDISVNLEGYTYLTKDENELTNYLTKSLGHEDIHKSLPNHSGDEEFIIQKMGY